jgi:hypothetical protein
VPPFLDAAAASLFALAVLHTFSVKRFQHAAKRYEAGSFGENLFHLLGEVEVVFGLWAAVLLVVLAGTLGEERMLHFLENADFTEPVFVFVIMVIASTKPILALTAKAISLFARALPLSGPAAFYFSALVLGPLLGSFITEPAAMTVTALLLKDRIFDKGGGSKFLYLSLGVLFVNVSIGGVLTPYAAPPVLMVAGKWGWDFGFMFSHFGWKAMVAVVVNAAGATWYARRELSAGAPEAAAAPSAPLGISLVHAVFLAAVVRYAHHPIAFLGAFLFFLGVVTVTSEYQEPLKLRESLLVGFFLGGLVVLGSFQQWWLKPLLESASETALFFGATALTAVTDNAALTFLGSQVPTLTEAMKYSLVAGAVVGGGLTVIANAPNPAGYSILRPSFGDEGISPLGLFLGALAPTIVACLSFWLLPSIG